MKTRREHLSGVLKDLAPDVVVVCEGPSRILVDTDSDDARRDIF